MTYFFLAAAFFAVFLAGDLAVGFFFDTGTDSHLRSIMGLLFNGDVN
jgi:hypothetical protein